MQTDESAVAYLIYTELHRIKHVHFIYLFKTNKMGFIVITSLISGPLSRQRVQLIIAVLIEIKLNTSQ